ncbi:hypothetical protein TIFTF001_005806 [Ficus carica]|uniref:Uncharacterized protein n=1 Tax=Ficus carica TaxID=3494 RepID=A0AA88A8X0_FICCA|nr:hypothetical protein TIFTF001_005806 [Ficus carica]
MNLPMVRRVHNRGKGKVENLDSSPTIEFHARDMVNTGELVMGRLRANLP